MSLADKLKMAGKIAIIGLPVLFYGCDQNKSYKSQIKAESEYGQREIDKGQAKEVTKLLEDYFKTGNKGFDSFDRCWSSHLKNYSRGMYEGVWKELSQNEVKLEKILSINFKTKDFDELGNKAMPLTPCAEARIQYLVTYKAEVLKGKSISFTGKYVLIKEDNKWLIFANYSE